MDFRDKLLTILLKSFDKTIDKRIGWIERRMNQKVFTETFASDFYLEEDLNKLGKLKNDILRIVMYIKDGEYRDNI